MRNKIIAMALLATITTLVYVACKTQKNIQKSSATSDSTALREVRVHDSIVVFDTSKTFFLNQFFNFSKNIDLDIGKIKMTEDETPKSATTLRFNIDSLNAHGDTLSATGEDGTKINIYTDKRTGEIVATITPQHGKKTTLEIDNVKLKTNTQIDSGKMLQRTKQGLSGTVVKDSASKDSLHNTATSANYSKVVERKPSVFAHFGVIVVIVIIVIIIILAIKYWKKIKSFLHI